jgi:protein-disulfide isomerase
VSARRERRRAELDQRRAQRRSRRPRQRQFPLLPVSVGAVVVGVLAIVGFALASTPPAPVELRQPLLRAPAELADGQALGAADAPVTVEVWSDFQCPGCGNFARQTEPQLIEDYVVPGDARLVYRDFAFLGQESVDAAVAARCAIPTNQFWAFHDLLFANQSGENRGTFSQARLEAIAAAVGLDGDTFRSCQSDPAVGQAVDESRAQGTDLGVNSTPTVVVNGELLPSAAYETLQAAIDQALNGGG